jgi:hypothetical protein
LTQSAEDEHTRDFLQFILNSIKIKEKIEVGKSRFFINQPETCEFSGVVIKVVDIPADPGIFAEFRCLRNSCSYWRLKHFAFLGIGIKMDCVRVSKSLKCLCCGENLHVVNFGVNACRFWMNGNFCSMQDINSCYTTLDEFHFYDWSELWLQAEILPVEDKENLEKVVMEAFSDTKIPKKKYCKRKGSEKLPVSTVDPDIASSVITLEKEIKDLDSQIYDLLLDNHKNHTLIQTLKTHLQSFQSLKKEE